MVHNNFYIYDLVKYINSKKEVVIICPDHGEFEQTPNVHMRGSGCPNCTSTISRGEIKWLDLYNIPSEFRQYKIIINGKRFKVDGFDPTINTIYEYDGDFWHGNPAIYNPNDENKICKKLFGTLYQRTVNKKNTLIFAGYQVISIWESDFIKQNKQNQQLTNNLEVDLVA